MSRYIKKFNRVGYALGPSEERGFALWAGYDLIGLSENLDDQGLINVENWPPEKLAEYGITMFTPVKPDDVETYRKLGIERKR
jgi:hypothetical protein